LIVQIKEDEVLPLTNCDPPSKRVDSLGCVYINIDCWISINESEPLCNDIGGTMFSADTEDDFRKMNEYLLASK